MPSRLNQTRVPVLSPDRQPTDEDYRACRLRLEGMFASTGRQIPPAELGAVWATLVGVYMYGYADGAATEDIKIAQALRRAKH